MPLPEPTSNEQQKDFIARCMIDDESGKEFPEIPQRRAVCQRIWDKSQKELAESQSDKVSESVEKSLETKLEDHKEKVGDDSRKQTTLRKLKIVYNRGIGAYRTNPESVRPSVKTPQQWAQARVNSFLYALRNLKYRSGKHDTDLLPDNHPMATKEAGALQETYNDYPDGAVNNAKRALKYKEENPDNDCGTPVGWARANQLAKRESISRSTIARMASFKRHQQHKDVPYSEGCGGLMWDAWGGTSGIEWAIRKLEQIDKAASVKMSKQFAFGITGLKESKVDKASGTMKGVSLISIGPALGHDLFVDGKSLGTILDEIEGSNLPAYITHRGALFEDRLTREIGFFTNFQISGERLLGDFQAFESFQEDDSRKFNRLFEMAEKMPERFGLSIVFNASLAWATESGDVESDEKPEDALFSFPSIRVAEVSSADFVDQPAANQKGLFRKIDSKPTNKMTKLELSELNESLEEANASLQEQNHLLSVEKADAEAESEGLKEKLSEHDEEMNALKEELASKSEEIESLKAQLEEKDAELAAKDEQMKEHDEAMKDATEKSEELVEQAKELSAKVDTLEQLIQGTAPVQLSSTDDSWSPSESNRDKIISEFAKKNNISEFSATLQLSRTQPEIFNNQK